MRHPFHRSPDEPVSLCFFLARSTNKVLIRRDSGYCITISTRQIIAVSRPTSTHTALRNGRSLSPFHTATPSGGCLQLPLRCSSTRRPQVPQPDGALERHRDVPHPGDPRVAHGDLVSRYSFMRPMYSVVATITRIEAVRGQEDRSRKRRWAASLARRPPVSGSSMANSKPR